MQLTELLDDLVVDLPEVGAIRQAGMMVGIELAPPEGAVRWGRRVSAECVRHGVLIRPLGDVVVLMPILTSTEQEIRRIVEVVAAAISTVGAQP